MQKQQTHDLLEMSALVSLIKSVVSQRVKFDVVVQNAAIQCIGQSIAYRNADPAKQLFESVGAHVQRPLVAYFEMFGNLALTGKGKDRTIGFFDVHKVTGKPALKWTSEYAAKVAETHWTKAAKEVAPKSKYDAVDILDAAFKRLDKLASDPGITLENKEAYIKAKGAYLGVLSGLLTSRSIDAKDLTADTRGFEKQQAFAQKAAEDKANQTGERTPATPEKVAELEQHFSGDRKAA